MVSLKDEEPRWVEAHAPYGPPGGKLGKAGFAISARLQLVLRGRHEHRREHASRPQLVTTSNPLTDEREMTIL